MKIIPDSYISKQQSFLWLKITQFDSMHMDISDLLKAHPYYWTACDVRDWLEWAVREYTLPDFNMDNFNMNGRALLLLEKQDFVNRAPVAGDVLFSFIRRARSLPYDPGALKHVYDNDENTNEPFDLTMPKPPQPSPTSSYPSEFSSDDSEFGAFGSSCSTMDGTRSESSATPDTSSRRNNGVTLDGPQQGPLDLSTDAIVSENTSGHEDMEVVDETAKEDAVECVEPRNGSDKKETVTILLWEFIHDMLKKPDQFGEIIKWDDEGTLTFRVVSPKGLAKLWGVQKRKSGMTYAKLSRALRYYYKLGILVKTPGQKLTYSYLKHPNDIVRGVRGARKGVPHKRRDPELKKRKKQAKDKQEPTAAAGGPDQSASAQGPLQPKSQASPNHGPVVSTPSGQGAVHPPSAVLRILPPSSDPPNSDRSVIHGAHDPGYVRIKREPQDDHANHSGLISEAEQLQAGNVSPRSRGSRRGSFPALIPISAADEELLRSNSRTHISPAATSTYQRYDSTSPRTGASSEPTRSPTDSDLRRGSFPPARRARNYQTDRRAWSPGHDGEPNDSTPSMYHSSPPHASGVRPHYNESSWAMNSAPTYISPLRPAQMSFNQFTPSHLSQQPRSQHPERNTDPIVYDMRKPPNV